MSVTSQGQQGYYIKLVLNILWNTDCSFKIACKCSSNLLLGDLKKRDISYLGKSNWPFLTEIRVKLLLLTGKGSIPGLLADSFLIPITSVFYNVFKY